jgi:hypothetical protein
MTDDRVNIKTDETTRDRLRSVKRNGETWDGLLLRAAEALEEHDRRGGQQTAPVCAECGEATSTWTIIDGSAFCEDCADVEF